ncbi:MAG TPA: hypothetical protein DFR83_02715 [Deltaproteobacteria bacterium]|nr:hypothetical protein [Deltaproteobacteria bacterium]
MTALTRAEVSQWVDAAHARWARGLEFRELRRGAQAVSDVYVHKRKAGGLAERAVDGRGKRAAFVVYFGGLHLLLVQDWMSGQAPPTVDRILDVGCGPGVVGAAAARWCGGVRLHASDRVGRHLEVAAWTARQLGVKARTSKATLPTVLESARPSSLVTLGWVLNELPSADRDATFSMLVRVVRKGAGALIFAPLSLRASPWWPELARTLRRATTEPLHETEHRFQPERPSLIADLDRATRLNHATMGARVMYVAPSRDSSRARASGSPG